MSSKRAIAQIKQRVELQIDSIPIDLPRFNDYLGGIAEEEMILLFGPTGSSKTKLSICLFVLNLIAWNRANPDRPVQAFYFTLELSAEEIWCNIFCYLLHKKTGKQYDIKFFRNKHRDNPLTEERLEEFDLIADELAILDKHLVISDKHRQPKPLYMSLETWILQNGTMEVDKEGVTHYRKKNPRQLVVVITDTINAFQADSDVDKYNSIKRWSEYYCKMMLKMVYKCCIINVQQSDKQSTTVQYNYQGKRNEDKFIPRVENLGIVKTTPDDHTTVISIYPPSRYQVEEYMGYNSQLMGDHFRYLTVLKSSHGEIDVGVGVWIDNAHLIAEECPPAELQEELQRFYLRKTGRSRLPAASTFNFDDIPSKKVA